MTATQRIAFSIPTDVGEMVRVRTISYCIPAQNDQGKNTRRSNIPSSVTNSDNPSSYAETIQY